MKKLSLRNLTLALLTSSALTMLAPSATLAQNLYFDGADTTSGNGAPIGGAGIWDGTTNNWTNDTAGTTNQAWVANSNAVFGGAAGGFIELEGDQNVGDITFDSPSYIIGDAGGVAGDLVLNAGTSLFTLSGITAISADISGAGELKTAGSSTLILSGNNSFSGGLGLSSGAVALQHNNAAGTGTITAGIGSMYLSTGLDVSNDMLIGSFYSINIIQNGGTATLSGNITNTGIGGIRKSGTGEIILFGTNNYSGNTTIINGTLTTQGGSAIGDNSAVSFFGSNDTLNILTNETIGSLSSSGATTGNSVTFGSGSVILTAGGNNSSTEFNGSLNSTTGQFNKAGTGVMEISGDNNSLASVQVQGGTLEITGANFSTVNGFVVENGARLVANNAGGNAISDSSMGVLVNAGGVFEIQTDEELSGVEGAGNIVLGGDLTTNNMTGGVATISGIVSGSGGFIKNDNWTLNVTNANTYTGDTTINNGIVNLTGSLASTTINLDNSAQLNANAAAFASGADISLSGTSNFTNNGNNTIDSISSIAGTTIDLSAGNLTTGNASNQTIAGLLTGAGSLTKQGTGTLTLSGNNNLTGGITLAGGTLSLQHDNAAGGAGNTITTTGSTMDYANGVNSATPININSNTTKLQVLTGTATQSGVISETSGPRPLEKIGAGELILSATNTYTGMATISAGTLSLTGGSAIADTGSVTTAATGTLNIMASETISAMNNAGAINLANGAIGNNLTLAGNYSGTGVINIDIDFSTDMADQLIIGGNVTGGATNIVVSDITTGAATGNDVLIVDVAGTSSAGDFTLSSGPITSGAFTYDLTQIGADWFLSQALSPLSATYEIYPQTLLALNKFSTLRSRISSRFYKSGKENGDNADVWGIIEASHAKLSPESSTTDSTYETSVWKMKSGVDGVLSANEDGRFVIGLNGYYGTASTNITSINGNGSIFTQGFGVGLSGTWFGNEGFYVDGQLQVGWNYSDLNSTSSGALVTDNLGQTYGASLEVGQEIALNDGLSITPNAQLSYANASFTGFTDSSGAVIGLDYANSLVGRVGIIIENEQTSEQGNTNLYALANVYYDMSGASQVDVSGTKLTTQPNRFSGEVGVGSSYIFGNGKYALNGEASLSSSFANATNDYQIKGRLGFKAKF